MDIFIVINTKPDFQVFDNFTAAQQFAIEKAKKRKCCDVYFEQTKLFADVPWADSHIEIIRRYVQG